jgi:hypothetical protein
MSDGSEPWRRLAAAILLRAVKDARGRPWSERDGPGDPSEARRWLRSIEARDLATALDVENSLRRWLHNGCPVRRGAKRHF